MREAEGVGVDAEVVEERRPVVQLTPPSHTAPLCTAIRRCGVPQPVAVAAVFWAKYTYQV